MRRALGAAAVALLAGCGRGRPQATEARTQTMEGFTLSQTDHGSRAWTLASRRATLEEDARVARLETPVMEFYQKGKAVSRVTSESGEVNVDTHDVRLSTAVVLDSYEDKSRLTTDVLLYSSQRRRFLTDSPVLVRRPEGVLRGKGLEATPDLSEIRIHEQRSVITQEPK